MKRVVTGLITFPTLLSGVVRVVTHVAYNSVVELAKSLAYL